MQLLLSLKKPLTARCILKISSAVILIVLALVTCEGSDQLPWDKWSWSAPQGPIEHFFRRSKDAIPVKGPVFQCECPPFKECKVEFKINEDMAEFLHLRGVIKEEDMKNFDDYLKQTTKMTTQMGFRRQNGGEDCCCPPRNVMMPTFITEHKFNEISKRIEEQASPKPSPE